MKPQSDLECRLQRMERTNRRMCATLCAIVATLGLCTMLGITTVEDPKELIARRFVLVDTEGRTLAVLGPSVSGGGRLELFVASSPWAPVVSASAETDGGHYRLDKPVETAIEALGRAGRGSIEMSATAQSNSLMFYWNNDAPFAGLGARAAGGWAYWAMPNPYSSFRIDPKKGGFSASMEQLQPAAP